MIKEDAIDDTSYAARTSVWELKLTREASRYPWPYAPRFRGFQAVVRHLAGGIDEIGNPIDNDYFDDTYFRNGLPERVDGYCTDVFFAECQRFITQRSEKPFFAYLPLNAMHSPHTVAEKYSATFRAEGHGDRRSKFLGQMIHFDENLGRLLDCLETHELAENTMVVFMGDNGTAAGAGDSGSETGFNAGMRGTKGSVYALACIHHAAGRRNRSTNTSSRPPIGAV